MIGDIRINSAAQIIEDFKILDIPLSRYFSSWFKLHPKAGSRDRKILNDLVYAYYRFYHLLGGINLREKIFSSYFLMGYSDPSIIGLFLEASYKTENLSFEDRKKIITEIFPLVKWGVIFPWKKWVSNSLILENITYSISHQPLLFIRVQETYALALAKRMKELGIEFEILEGNCWALRNRTHLNDIKEGALKSSFEIQDYSSQRTGLYFLAEPRSNWWDCCAGGGGKSLLLSSLSPKANLWASDSRASVISNLESRFMESNFPAPRSFVQDLLTEDNLPFRESFFDGIILDAPCTGSGTWSRTPERLANFHESSLTRITDIQRRINDKIFPYLKPEGHLIYITCSVFKAENEDIVQYLVEKYGFLLENQVYLDGSTQGADTLFVARLKK